MKERIEKWLEDPQSYWEGVKLYEAAGDRDFLKRLFRKSEDDYNHEKLREALTQWLGTQLEKEASKQEQMPESLKEKMELGKRLMDKRAALKERMRVFYHQQQPAEQLKPLAFEILAITKELDGIYSEERFWEVTGYLPEKETVSDNSIEYLLKRRLSVRTYVTKYGKSRDMVKLQKYQNELWELEEKLKAHGVI